MFDRLRTQVLRLLKVPHEPTPPAGAPGSTRVFRAGRNFYKLRLLGWGFGQIGALFGIIVSLVLLDRLETNVNAQRAATPAIPPAPRTAPNSSAPTAEPPPAQPPLERKSKPARAGLTTKKVVAHWPTWVFPLLKLAEFAGVVLYLLQIPLTYAMARLDYELRWYLVTDRSLRIRSGLATVQESTMSFANLQQVVVSQGPLQRLLGLADVRVQSAGGGGDEHHKGGGDSLHTGVFHGVDNAVEIRDLILERLRRYRETGLGDPDESAISATRPPVVAPAGTALAAARELLAEARALRAVA